MISVEKIKQEKCQPPLLRSPAPTPYFHLPFFNFSDAHPAPSFRKGEGGPKYAK